MIRVYKHTIAPTSLTKGKKYDAQDVHAQLIADQYGKCYLCERVCVTDYQIEHFQSQRNFEDLICDWNNLYLACSYCNGKKSNSFDSLYAPAKNDVEDEISCFVDFKNKQASFQKIIEKEGIDITIKLLHNIYNGTKGLRTIKEERFFEYFTLQMDLFRSILLKYKDTKSDRYKAAVEESVQIDKEFLGFKYQILKSSTLFDEFKSKLIWNKQIA